ncbi:MBL fold metallo-hydrolase [Gordonia humi]|uniref:Glyoxylase-like metal-dependent hydrolase (Beta-lactamase superfamily II) n=1 Tax=Gordonia humi TaxID=686429 RepID=A0A840EV17_9ACTN|nr:MBL fold metallo-hydrolase [Gordonia humi]MBB4136775.1 glyoxylase-like metal-dependent hydrolase (beta-lactamase superfamily II) [Gordonia humi]
MTQQITVSDEYTGNVSPDGDDQQNKAQRRDLDNATVVKLSVGPMDNNVYVVTDKATGDALLIDAANDAGVLLDLAEQIPGTVKQIVTTHGHFDHWQALDEVSTGLAVPHAVGTADAGDLPVTADRLLSDGDTVVVGELTLDVIGIVGHTLGSVALALTEQSGRVHLFTGDTLFPGGVGKTWQPGDFEILLGDVETKFFGRYGDDTVVYPGHGKDTTLGAERPGLPEWRARGW